MKERYLIKYCGLHEQLAWHRVNSITIGLKGANNRVRSAAYFRTVCVSLQDTQQVRDGFGIERFRNMLRKRFLRAVGPPNVRFDY